MELQDVQLVAEGLEFPEGPVGLDDGSVIVCEVNIGRLTRLHTDGTRSTVAEAGGGPSGLAFGPDDALYVCNGGGFGSRHSMPGCIQRVDVNTGETSILYTECDGRALTSPNDLVFDSHGNMWFTDLGGGRVHSAKSDGSSITVAVKHAPTCNGIGLSPDESIVYWAQTTTRQVMRRRIEAPGVVVPTPGCDSMTMSFRGKIDPWVLLAGLPGMQELDSLAVDSSGSVCVGTLVDSGITVISPEGEVTKFTLPEEFAEPIVTNICFGGPDMTTAYITLALTGRVVSCRWPVPGHRLAFNG